MGDIYGSRGARFPNGIVTNEMDALNGTSEIDLEGNEIDFIADAVLINGVPISGPGAVQNPLQSNLNLGSFDIVGTLGLSLNGINTKTQNLSAVGSVSTLNGDVVLSNATTIPLRINGSVVQQINSSSGGCTSIMENSKAGGVLSGENIGALAAKAWNETNAPITVGEVGFRSSQNHVVGASGTDFVVMTTPQNTAISTERLRIGSDNTTTITGNLGTSLNTESKTFSEEGVSGEILKLKNTNTYYSGAGAAAVMTGDRSVAIGIGASGVGTTNDSSTAVGAYACGNIQGLYNTGFGAYAGSGNPGTTGNYNTCVGINAMRFTENMCDSNTVIGSSSGRYLDTADQNVIVGASSCGSTVNLNHNTCVGTFTEGFGNNSIALGHDATCLKDNQCVIGDVALAEIVPGGNGVCDLGSTTNAFKDVYMSGLLNNLTPIGGLYMTTSNGNVITGTVADTSLLAGASSVGFLEVPANAFSISSYHFNTAGEISTNNGDTLTLSLKNGGVLASLIVPLTGSSSEYFELEGDFSIRALGVAGVAEISTNFDLTYSDAATSLRGKRVCTVNSTTFDTTISNTLDLSAQWSSLSANNSIQCLQAFLTKTY